MEYILTPEYTFPRCKVSQSDIDRIQRCWDLYGDFEGENNFQLAAGLYDGAWLSGGSNERRSHAHRYPYSEALHAEQVAIMSARCSYKGANLYVCRMSEHDGEFKLAKPCFWCMHNIIKANINKVFYTGDNNEVISFKVSKVKIQSIASLDMKFAMSF